MRLEPIDVERHGADLQAAQAEAPEIWMYLPDGPFAGEADFGAWLVARAASLDPLFYGIVDRATGRANGMASYLRITPEHGVIEVGYIWYSPVLQRTRAATETMYLMARHVFEDLGYRRYEWKCNELNAPSRRAALRLGFTYEGVFRQHMVVKDQNRNTAWYSMLDSEWPAAKAAFESWLEPDNFDGEGRQLRGLADFRNNPGKPGVGR
ncbi:MAG TPA: GNAT family protein [Candidatus Dormibacteraeota bacterium]